LKSRILPRGAERCIFVMASHVHENLTTPTVDKPMIGVFEKREDGSFKPVEYFKRVEILGHATLEHMTQAPLPGTDGRAICYLTTCSPILVVG
jgi:hypothetical protein